MVSNSGSGPLDDTVIRDIRRLWEDELLPVPLDAVQRQDVSPATAALLGEVGLPSNGPVEVEFFHDRRLLDRVVINGVSYLGIGLETGIRLLALRAGTDEVRAVIDYPGARPGFVNSTLADFLAFLGLLRSRLDEIRGGDAAAAVAALRREFAQRDPRALDDVEAWWDEVLEQAEEGEL